MSFQFFVDENPEFFSVFLHDLLFFLSSSKKPHTISSLNVTVQRQEFSELKIPCNTVVAVDIAACCFLTLLLFFSLHVNILWIMIRILI